MLKGMLDLMGDARVTDLPGDYKEKGSFLAGKGFDSCQVSFTGTDLTVEPCLKLPTIRTANSNQKEN